MGDPGLAGAVPFRFACQRCARCCSGGAGFVWVEHDEIERMARALETSPASFASRFVRRAIDPRTGDERLALREDEAEGGRCALLAGARECSVYEARPEHCRTFPYWPSVLGGGEGFEAARATCPGIAVVVDPELRGRAFEALEALHAGKPCGNPAGGCCLDRPEADSLYVTALEADYAAERRLDEGGCRLGPARPLGCRVGSVRSTEARSTEARSTEARSADVAAADAARWDELRALERSLGYPLGYGPVRPMLRARGVEVGS